MVSVAEGRLHRYYHGKNLTMFEYLSESANASRSLFPRPNTLIFVGGLSDSFLSVPYVPLLASYICQCPDWSIMEIQLSSSGLAWGTTSLNNDSYEISRAIEYVRDSVRDSYPNASVVAKRGRVVLMGHSTGSQDILHYLTHTTSHGRPSVEGAILQAAVSDREGLAMLCEEDEELRKAYDECVRFAVDTREKAESSANSILPLELTAALGWPDVAVSCERFLSLTSPSSPDRPEPDDLFSSDLSDESLKRTFGQVGRLGLLKPSNTVESTPLILLSEKDEYTPHTVNKEKLIGRWSSALAAGGSVLAAGSGVIAGASHNVKEKGARLYLTKRVMEYLQSVAGAIPQAVLLQLDQDTRCFHEI